MMKVSRTFSRITKVVAVVGCLAPLFHASTTALADDVSFASGNRNPQSQPEFAFPKIDSEMHGPTEQPTPGLPPNILQHHEVSERFSAVAGKVPLVGEATTRSLDYSMNIKEFEPRLLHVVSVGKRGEYEDAIGEYYYRALFAGGIVVLGQKFDERVTKGIERHVAKTNLRDGAAKDIWAIGTLGFVGISTETDSNSRRISSWLNKREDNKLMAWHIAPLGDIVEELTVEPPEGLAHTAIGIDVATLPNGDPILLGRGRTADGHSAILIGRRGKTAWTRYFAEPGAALSPVGLAVATTKEGSELLIVANRGSLLGKGDDGRIVLLGVDPDTGKELPGGRRIAELFDWAVPMEANDIVALADGSFVVTGAIRIRSDVDALAFRIDRHGNVAWARACGGTENDYAFSAQPGSDNSIYVFGMTRSKFTEQIPKETFGRYQTVDQWSGMLLRLDADGILSLEMATPSLPIAAFENGSHDELRVFVGDTLQIYPLRHELGAEFDLLGSTPWYFGHPKSLLINHVHLPTEWRSSNIHDPALTCYAIDTRATAAAHEYARSYSDKAFERYVRDWRFAIVYGSPK